MTREAVAKRIRPFLLRRLKIDVLKELPDKIESLQASEAAAGSEEAVCDLFGEATARNIEASER